MAGPFGLRKLGVQVCIGRKSLYGTLSTLNIELKDNSMKSDDHIKHVLLASRNREMESDLTIDAVYSNAFSMLRKYADMSISIRHGVFIQGIVVVSGSGVLLSEGKPLLAAMASLFTIAMTWILNILHQHYNAYFFSVRHYIQHIERLHLKGTAIGYVEFVETERDTRVEGQTFGWMKNFGSFVLIGGSGVIVLIASLLTLFFAEPENNSEPKEAPNAPQYHVIPVKA